MSCGQTPRRRHDEPHRTRWRPIEQTARRLPRGFLWPRGDRGTPRYLMKPPSRGAWRCKRGRGRSLPLAVRTKRNAGMRSAPKPCSRPLSHDDTPQPPHWTASVKASLGTLAALAAAPTVSRSEARIAHFNLATPPPRGRVMRTRGVIDRTSRPRTGGAQSVRRHTRPSRPSGPAAGRSRPIGRCAPRPSAWR